MTRSLRTFVVAFLAALSLATGMVLAQAQPGKATVQPRGTVAPAANGPRPAAGNPAPSAAAKPDPILEAILRNWEISSAKIKTLDGKHIRSRSNSVFATDARAAGEFHFEAPDKGSIDITGAPPPKGAVSSKKTDKGEPYSLIADRAERWICDGKRVLMIKEEEKEYESIELPEEMRGTNIIESPLPFLFGMKAAAAKERFQMELIQFNREQKYARITAVPLQAKDAQNFIRAEIVLDTEKFLPKFVSLTDPAGTIVTQYIFQDVVVNNATLGQKWRELVGGDPFKPNLRGYKMVQPPPVVDRAGGPIPGGAASKISPTGGKTPAPNFPPQSNGNPRSNSAVVPRFAPR